MLKTIVQMTCEELTAAYVILRHLENISNTFTHVTDFEKYIRWLKYVVETTHHDKLEDMRKEFFKEKKNVQH